MLTLRIKNLISFSTAYQRLRTTWIPVSDLLCDRIYEHIVKMTGLRVEKNRTVSWSISVWIRSLFLIIEYTDFYSVVKIVFLYNLKVNCHLHRVDFFIFVIFVIKKLQIQYNLSVLLYNLEYWISNFITKIK